MRIGAELLLWTLSAAPCAASQDAGGHQDPFTDALEHRAGDDLRKWKESHPWSLGDRIAGFLERLLATRKAGERISVERAEVDAAYLAETLAEDPFTGWILQVHEWDSEACARHETVLAAVSELPGLIAAGEVDSAWTEIADLRAHVAPPGGWALCAPDLARTAAAYLHAGRRERARELATEIAAVAAELQQGSVLAACERVLGEIALETGDLADAERRISRSTEIRSGLDSGARGAFPVEIERLEPCQIDTLVEFAIGEKETLVVVVGPAGATARRLLAPRAAIEALVRRVLDPASFDEKAARELHGMLLLPFEAQLGARIGVFAVGIDSILPLETGIGRDHAIVHLASPPLGGVDPIPSSGSLAIAGEAQDEASRSPLLAWLHGRTEGRLAPVRTIRPRTAGDLAHEAAGARWIHFEDLAGLDADGLRSLHLNADLVVLAKRGEAGVGRMVLAQAFHAAGVRDVVASLWPVDAANEAFLLRFYGHLAGGASVPDAMRAARRDLIDGDPAASVSPSGPRVWAAWIVHRRS